MFRKLDDDQCLADALTEQSKAALQLGDFATATTQYAEVTDLYRRLSDDTGLAWALYNQGGAAGLSGDLASATIHFDEAAGLFRKLGDDEGVARTRDLQAVLAEQQDGQN